MQVSKFLWVVCATTVCAAFLSVHAQDTPAQAAARAALLQSMGQPAAPAVPAAPAKDAPILVESSGVVNQQTNAPTQTNEIAISMPATNAPAAAPIAMAPQPLDSAAQAAARAALLQSMGQNDIPAAAKPVPAVVAPVVAAPAPATPAVPEMKPVATKPAKANNATVVGQEPGFPPMIAPPVPISAAKQQQLDALLAQYQANLISPEEYQKQRAAILAAP
jgi:hypothetical protein